MMWSNLLHDPAREAWRIFTTRGVRLTFYLVLTAALFPSSRFILLMVMITTLAVLWTRDYRRNRSRRIIGLAVAVVLVAVGYGIARFNVTAVDELRLTKSPWGPGINLVADG